MMMRRLGLNYLRPDPRTRRKVQHWCSSVVCSPADCATERSSGWCLETSKTSDWKALERVIPWRG